MSYDMIDRFLRNNLGDDDYAEYSAALDSLCTPPQRTWVRLTDRDIEAIWGEDVSLMHSGHYDAVRAIEAKLKEKNT